MSISAHICIFAKIYLPILFLKHENERMAGAQDQRIFEYFFEVIWQLFQFHKATPIFFYLELKDFCISPAIHSNKLGLHILQQIDQLRNCLIPARDGSKRLPRKNIKMLANKPLINWTIDKALNSPCLLNVIVSTDNLEIASIAKLAGVSIPWIRPSQLASENATSVAVAIHALEMYEITNGRIDGLPILQPKTPFRNVKTIISGTELFEKFGDTLIRVSQTRKHTKSGFQIRNSKLVPFPEQNQNPHFDFLQNIK